LSGLSISSGSDYYLKWTFTGLGGSTNGQGIGIDNFSVTATGAGLSTPPALTAAPGATVDANFDITFTDDATWRGAVTLVKYGATTLTNVIDYSLTAGILTLKPSGGNPALQTAQTQIVTVTATGYNDATVSQTIGAGAPAKLAITTQPTAPPSNGAALATQPVVAIRDQYGNATTSTAAVVANVGSGSWTVGGTTSKNGVSGTATFTDLTATSGAAVTGATIDFTSTGLTHIESAPFNIPGAFASEPTIQASGVNFTSVGQTSMTVNWTNGNGTNRIVLAKQVSAVDSNPADGISYTANTAFGSGSQIGSGNWVVFNGTGNSVTVTGLAGGTVYQFAVYEFNGAAGTENYLTTLPATGSQATTVATYTWNAGGTASWATASNWTPSRTTPSSSDILQFNAGGTVTVTNVPTQTIGQLLLSNSSVVNLQTASANTLTISGGTGADLSVPSGSQLNTSGGSALAILVATGATGDVSGSMTFTSAGHTLNAVDASGITFNTGAAFTQGTGATGNAFTNAGTANAIVFATGSTFTQLGGSNPFGLGQPASKVVFQTGSLFSIQQNSAPAFSGRTYANLEINAVGFSQSGTGSAALSIDNLTITTGVLNLGMTGTFNLKGNVSVGSGQTLNFNPSPAGTVTLNGTTARTIGGTGTLTFGANQSITVNNSAGVTLQKSVASNGVLTLTTDLTVAPGSVLTENGTSLGSGDLIGDVMRTDLTSTGKSFGNPNNQIAINSGTITSATMNLDKGETPTDFPQSVLRNYTITPGAGALTQATVRLHYLDTELNSNIEDATLHLWRNSGGWVDVGQSSAEFTDNWVEYNNVTGFSPWTISGPAAPTAVRLTKFNASSFSDGVSIVWESGFEVNNLGYNIYREQNGLRTRLTPAPVAGSALKVGPGARMTAGYSYSWLDPDGTPGALYYLESIDLNGTREMSGAVRPMLGAGFSPASRKRAMLLNEVARLDDSGAAAVTPAKVTDYPAAMKASAISVSGSANWKNAANLDTQRAIAAGRAVKIAVPQSGWYRATQPELLAAGLDPNSDARRLQLFVDGEELPMRVNGDQNRLGANDSIEFYGVALDTTATDTHVYWLVNGATPGKRITPGKRTTVKGNISFADSVRSAAGFNMTTARRDKLVYFSGLLNGDGENIFGPPVTSDPLAQVLSVRNIDAEGPAQAQVSVTLQGLTAVDHVVDVQLNGHSLGAINFNGLGHPAQTFMAERAFLREGDNTVTLTSTNGDADVSLVDSVSLTYSHAYRADHNALRFSATAGQPIMVSGFTSQDIRVVDVTNPADPTDLSVSVGAQGSGYAFKLQPGGAGTRSYMAFTEDLAQHAAVAANQPSTLNAKRSTDLLIVTHKDFRAAVEPLAAQRRSEGLQVTVVDIEDVYDEFSFGAHSPFALRDFIGWTASHWDRAPRYLLLAGDSSWDPRNYLEQGNGDFVPTKLIDTGYMETASDDWLADFNGDGAADIAVGRLPGRTAAEVGRMVAKLLVYEQERQSGGPARGALLVADNGFEGKSLATSTLLPPGIAVQSINRSTVGSDDVMRGQIVDGIDSGPMIVNYYGHGSVTVWTGAGLLDSDLALGLTNNSKPSLFVMMTCLNGYAHDAYIDSLAESLLKAENGGAMAVWASSGFTEAEPQFAMSQQFYRQLFSGAGMRIGDAARAAKAATSNSDVRRTWMLLGDPSMRLR
jgi:hypothetical protein